MRTGSGRTILWTPALGLAFALGGCFGEQHPDPARYEYLYIEGAFQPPHTAFPTGAGRTGWKCFDRKSGREFDCTFVHRGWDQYDYIYRRR